MTLKDIQNTAPVIMAKPHMSALCLCESVDGCEAHTPQSLAGRAARTAPGLQTIARPAHTRHAIGRNRAW